MMQPERERQLRRDFVRSSPINVDQSLHMMREYDEDAVEQLRDEDLDPTRPIPSGAPRIVRPAAPAKGWGPRKQDPRKVSRAGAPKAGWKGSGTQFFEVTVQTAQSLAIDLTPAKRIAQQRECRDSFGNQL